MAYNSKMATTIGVAIDRYCENNGLSIPKFAAWFGVNQQTVYCWKNGTRKPKDPIHRKKLQELLGLTLEEVLGMEAGPPPPLGEPSSDFLQIPIVEPRIAAGPPETIFSEETKEYAFVHRRALRSAQSKKLICTFVNGNSMEPILRDGAIVCIDLMARPERRKIPPKSIWAIRKDGGAVVKYLQIKKNTFILISANDTHEAELVDDPEAIIGRVVWVWQSL